MNHQLNISPFLGVRAAEIRKRSYTTHGIVMENGCRHRSNARMSRWRLIIPTFLVFAAMTLPAFAEKRVALVIGNGTYQSVAALPSPVTSRPWRTFSVMPDSTSCGSK